MSKAQDTCNEINAITTRLIELGLSNDQNYSFLKSVGRDRETVDFPRDQDFSIILKNVPYDELYATIKQAREYNVSLADGALLQLQYSFEEDEVVKHRLAFFPSPDLTEYQNDPEVYDQDIIYAEILDRRVVPTPIRFDFDRHSFISVQHPMSHVTIGQYKNCRIPLKSALSPFRFIEFILGSFYNTAFNNYRNKISNTGIIHPTTITPDECLGVHLSLEA